MTPTRVAAGASEAQAIPGRGRNQLAGKDQHFDAILSDVAQEETPDGVAPTEGKATSARPAPAAARTPASIVALPLDVDALLAQMAKPVPAGTPTLATAAPSQSQASKTQEGKPKPGDGPGDRGERGATDGRGASTDLSVVASAALAAQTTPSFAANAAGVRALFGNAPIAAAATNAEHAPTAAVARLAARTARNVAHARSSQGGDLSSAIQVEAKPVAASTDAGTVSAGTTQAIAPAQPAARTSPNASVAQSRRDGDLPSEIQGDAEPVPAGAGAGSPGAAVAQTISTTQVTVVEVASHLAPAQPSPPISPNAPDAQSRHDGDPPPAIQTEAEPVAAGADAGTPGAAVMQTISPPEAALVEGATHLAPAQPVARTSPNAPDAQSPRGGALPSAIQTEGKPAPNAGSAGAATAQTISSREAALVAGHLTPVQSARATPQGVSGPATPTAAHSGPATAKTAASPKPVEATPVRPVTDDEQADHQVVAVPSLTANAAEAVTGHPLQQIADAVIALAADTPRAATAQATAARPSPTRSLILHLAPATLGAITVRLHLTGSGLSVRLAVENPTTLGLISHAREALQAAICTTNTLDQLVIHGADTTPPPSTGSHDSTRSDRGTLADQRSGGQRRNEESSQQPSRQVPHEARAAGAGRSDGLFL